MPLAHLLIVASLGLQADPSPEALFQELLWHRRRQYFKGGCGTRGPWRPGPEQLFREAYPEHSERFAIELLENPESQVPDLFYALDFVEWLTPRTSPELEALLLRLTDHAEQDLADRALELLSSAYGQRRHRALFRHRAREGSTAALMALSTDVDEETIRFLETLEVHPSECRRALDRIRILQSLDWKEQIASLIRKEEGESEWAENVAARRAPELLRAYYQRKVDAHRARLEPLLRDSRDPNSFAYWFAHGASFNRLGRYDLDWDLFALADWGGELKPIEKLRLSSMGLFGNAKRKLTEMLKVR